MRARGLMVSFAVAAAANAGCGPSRPLERQLVKPREVRAVSPAASPFLKAHMRDGRLYVLSSWSVDDHGDWVSGSGRLLGVDRSQVETGSYQIQVTDVALFETNAPLRTSPAIVAMTVVTAASLTGTALCLANPKACFGSCPTFYVSDGERPLLQAEGFSDAVSPALAATDVDALYRARPSGRALDVRMTNEALETHVVDAVEVLAAPRPPDGRVFYAAGDGFYGASGLTAAADCEAPEGACEGPLRAFDGQERRSLTDEHDLGAREELTLTFPAGAAAGGDGGARGLVIAARETLLTTYLLYQTLAYLGSEAGAALSRLERDPSMAESLKASHHRLGDIQISVEDAAGRWTRAGVVFETGPIATDVHLVKLPPAPAGRPQRVRLGMTRGNWRLDWVALAALGPRLEPAPLAARQITGVTDDGRRVTPAAGQRIVTLPGDAYQFHFELPDDPERLELFLSSRGYYIEWMREAWLKEESPARAALLLAAPSLALRVLAPEFKRQEAGMEKLFWESRYARH